MSPQMSGRLALFTDLTSVTRVLDVTVCAVSRATWPHGIVPLALSL
jgi:hypothetical protein